MLKVITCFKWVMDEADIKVDAEFAQTDSRSGGI